MGNLLTHKVINKEVGDLQGFVKGEPSFHLPNYFLFLPLKVPITFATSFSPSHQPSGLPLSAPQHPQFSLLSSPQQPVPGKTLTKLHSAGSAGFSCMVWNLRGVPYFPLYPFSTLFLPPPSSWQSPYSQPFPAFFSTPTNQSTFYLPPFPYFFPFISHLSP